MTYIREDQADIRVTVDGVPYGDSWASAEGGNLEADNSKTRPGGMGKEVDVGGPASRDDLTVATQLSDVSAGWVPRLENRVGIGTVKVGVTFLGPERTPAGRPQTRVGILKAVNAPDMDAESSDVAMLELVVGLHEQAA